MAEITILHISDLHFGYLMAKPKIGKVSSTLTAEIMRCADRFTQKWGDNPQYADQAYFDRAMVEKECGSKKNIRRN